MRGMNKGVSLPSLSMTPNSFHGTDRIRPLEIRCTSAVRLSDSGAFSPINLQSPPNLFYGNWSINIFNFFLGLILVID